MKIKISDLTAGKPVRFELEGESVCIARIDSEVFAVGDTCSHAEASLSEGEISGNLIECWLHGAQFDLRTGAAVTPPATEPIPTYEVSYEGEYAVIGKGRK